MTQEVRIESFCRLGGLLSNPCSDPAILVAIEQSVKHNAWFTHEDIVFALKHWGAILSTENLTRWVESYDFCSTQEKVVGVVMAGNLPLVGFHDFLSVLMSGHICACKLSSNDLFLLPAIVDKLIEIQPKFGAKILFCDRLKNFDAVIATGSNNTARYFEAYFGKYPHIIRRNRCSVAILDANEKNLKGLCDDVFRYMSLGCRSVSKLFVPRGYALEPFLQHALSLYGGLKDHHKYRNNLDYQRCLFQMHGAPFIDGEMVLLSEDDRLQSPLSVLFYEYYDDAEEVINRRIPKEDVQCIATNLFRGDAYTPIGTTQTPGLDVYADGVDTLAFLSAL